MKSKGVVGRVILVAVLSGFLGAEDGGLREVEAGQIYRPEEVQTYFIKDEAFAIEQFQKMIVGLEGCISDIQRNGMNAEEVVFRLKLPSKSPEFPVVLVVVRLSDLILKGYFKSSVKEARFCDNPGRIVGWDPKKNKFGGTLVRVGEKLIANGTVEIGAQGIIMQNSEVTMIGGLDFRKKK